MMDKELLGFDTEDLQKLSQWQMPFGRFAGRRLIDLPEEYLLWFEKNDFPDGQLGQLMQLCLQIKIAGADGLLKKLPAE